MNLLKVIQLVSKTKSYSRLLPSFIKNAIIRLGS